MSHKGVRPRLGLGTPEFAWASNLLMTAVTSTASSVVSRRISTVNTPSFRQRRRGGGARPHQHSHTSASEGSGTPEPLGGDRGLLPLPTPPHPLAPLSALLHPTDLVTCAPATHSCRAVEPEDSTKGRAGRQAPAVFGQPDSISQFPSLARRQCCCPAHHGCPL